MAEDQNREELANFAKQIDNDLNPSAPAENAADPATSSPAAPAANGMDTLAAEMKMLASGILRMVFPAFPSLREIYTEEVVDGLCAGGSAVCKKHGWLQDGIGGKYAEELALGFMVIPLAIATKGAIQHDIAIIKARQQNPDGNGMADSEKVQKAAA